MVRDDQEEEQEVGGDEVGVAQEDDQEVEVQQEVDEDLEAVLDALSFCPPAQRALIGNFIGKMSDSFAKIMSKRK